jgi:hypothetical protein
VLLAASFRRTAATVLSIALVAGTLTNAPAAIASSLPSGVTVANNPTGGDGNSSATPFEYEVTIDCGQLGVSGTGFLNPRGVFEKFYRIVVKTVNCPDRAGINPTTRAEFQTEFQGIAVVPFVDMTQQGSAPTATFQSPVFEPTATENTARVVFLTSMATFGDAGVTLIFEADSAAGSGGGAGGPCVPPPSTQLAEGDSVIYRPACSSWDVIADGGSVEFGQAGIGVLEVRYNAPQTITRIVASATGAVTFTEPNPTPTACSMNFIVSGAPLTATPATTAGVSPCEATGTVNQGQTVLSAIRVSIPSVGTETVTFEWFNGQTSVKKVTVSVTRPGSQQQVPATTPAPMQLSLPGVARAVASPGAVWATVGGERVQPDVSSVNGSISTRVGTVELALTADNNDEALPGGGFVAPGGELDITASGFFPLTAVHVFSVSEQRLLQTVIVNADGTVAIDVTLPERENACRETLQIAGSDANAAGIAANLTLRYALDHPFADANPVHEGSIACLATRGIVNGVTPDQIAADSPVTLGQIATMLARLLNLEVETSASLASTGQTVHTDAIRTLTAQGLLPDTGRTLRANTPLSRAELAAIVARVAALGSTGATTFGDVDGELAGIVAALQDAGIVRGVRSGQFKPNALATRAQAATMLDNLLALLETN